MTANEWPAIDSSAVSASSDLFGGDLFGDELMDMYNSSAVPDGHHDANIESIGGEFSCLRWVYIWDIFLPPTIFDNPHIHVCLNNISHR